MSIRRTRVYVAGPLTPRGLWSQNPAIEYLINVRKMVKEAKDLMLAGYDPFIPALDFLLFIVDARPLTEAMIKRYSKSWLMACDCMYLTKGWRSSSGTMAEKKLAEELGIPVFHNREEMDEHFKET
ncbi:MAG: DUF4406 domain-containing protein [Deltaproteobacteria bacterium]|nr:DUF4406 domain-containing protein [Deltaproteobacteria bacterium]